jgi:superfamily II DNA/RNA helicase
MGRTARAGKKGKCVLIVMEEEKKLIDTLREAGVTEMRTWAELTEPEYCEDCGVPLYPNHAGEVVHAEMPEDAEPDGTHFH